MAWPGMQFVFASLLAAASAKGISESSNSGWQFVALQQLPATGCDTLGTCFAL
jgi:hypothetical protein